MRQAEFSKRTQKLLNYKEKIGLVQCFNIMKRVEMQATEGKEGFAIYLSKKNS